MRGMTTPTRAEVTRTNNDPSEAARLSDDLSELAEAFETSSRENHTELGHSGDWDTCPRVGCTEDRKAIAKVERRG